MDEDEVIHETCCVPYSLMRMEEEKDFDIIQGDYEDLEMKVGLKLRQHDFTWLGRFAKIVTCEKYSSLEERGRDVQAFF